MSPTKRHWTSLLATALCGLALFIAWAALRKPEPTYNGKTISAWAEQFGTNRSRSSASDDARHAIKQIGTNGIPTLLQMLAARKSASQATIRRFVPGKFHGRLGLVEDWSRRNRAGARALTALGDDARIAIPSLITIASAHPEIEGRAIVIETLATLRSAAEPAIPFLIESLHHRSDRIRVEAASALGAIESKGTVPALVDYLRFATSSLGQPIEVSVAVQALKRFREDARPALPILSNLLDHTNFALRSDVTNALYRIDP